jgi:RNA polymerase sigma-70 factor (ECF subfamily)
MGAMDAEESWIAVVRGTLPELYAFVSRRVGGDRAAAEDVTQEAWLRAVRAWRREGLPSEPLAWLKTVARRLIANAARGASRAPEQRELDLDAVVARVEPHAPSSDEAALLQLALARVGGSEAVLLEAFHFDGRNTRELAEEFRTSERAIEGRLRRARAKLRRALERVAR